MKRIAFVFVMTMLCRFTYGQTDLELLVRVKSYVAAKYIGFVLSQSLERANSEGIKHINSILEKNRLSNPFSYSELNVLLKNNSDTSVLRFAAGVHQINIIELTALDPPKAIERLSNEAYYILQETLTTSAVPQIKNIVYEQVLLELETMNSEENNTALGERADIAKLSNNKPVIKNWELWLGLLLFANAAVIGYAFLRLAKIKSKLTEAKQTITNLKEKKQNEKSKFLPVYNEFRTLVTDKLKEYEARLFKLQKQLEQQDVTRQEEATVINAPTTKQSVQEIYMRAPSGNYFLSNAFTTKENAFYKLTVKEDNQKASFEIINDGAPLSVAITQRSIFLEPACFATNKPGNNTRKIVTSFQGRAVYVNDVWVIEQKAIIVFA